MEVKGRKVLNFRDINRAVNRAKKGHLAVFRRLNTDSSKGVACFATKYPWSPLIAGPYMPEHARTYSTLTCDNSSIGGIKGVENKGVVSCVAGEDLDSLQPSAVHLPAATDKDSPIHVAMVETDAPHTLKAYQKHISTGKKLLNEGMWEKIKEHATKAGLQDDLENPNEVQVPSFSVRLRCVCCAFHSPPPHTHTQPGREILAPWQKSLLSPQKSRGFTGVKRIDQAGGEAQEQHKLHARDLPVGDPSRRGHAKRRQEHGRRISLPVQAHHRPKVLHRHVQA
jgi:hypothetical protein